MSKEAKQLADIGKQRAEQFLQEGINKFGGVLLPSPQDDGLHIHTLRKRTKTFPESINSFGAKDFILFVTSIIFAVAVAVLTKNLV